MSLSTYFCRLLPVATILLLACGARGETISAQPLRVADSLGVEQTDFMPIWGYVPRVGRVPELVFTATSALLRGGQETRSMYVQSLMDYRTKQIVDPAQTFVAPQLLANFTVKRFAKFDNFVANPVTDSYGKIYFHVPGRGLFANFYGRVVAPIRAETSVYTQSNFVLRLPSSELATKASARAYDYTKESRGFFASYIPGYGSEPLIAAGSALTLRLLKDIETERGVGSAAEQFTVFGPEDETQEVFFVAKSPADRLPPAAGSAPSATDDPLQLWHIMATHPQGPNRPTVYVTAPFSTVAADGSTTAALPNPPKQIIANASDLFFTMVPDGETVPELYHLPFAGLLTGLPDASQIERVTYSGADPQMLTFQGKDANNPAGNLAFAALDSSGVRRLAFWQPTVGVYIEDGNGLKNPRSIVDAGQSFYFVAQPEDGGAFSLYRDHGYYAPDLIGSYTYSSINNIGEMRVVTGTGGFGDGQLYFVADGLSEDESATPVKGVLFTMPANDTYTATADLVITPQGNPVSGAKNMRDVVIGDTVRRLYFCAPVSDAKNQEFVPSGTKRDYGTKPWVVSY